MLFHQILYLASLFIDFLIFDFSGFIEISSFFPLRSNSGTQLNIIRRIFLQFLDLGGLCSFHKFLDLA